MRKSLLLLFALVLCTFLALELMEAFTGRQTFFLKQVSWKPRAPAALPAPVSGGIGEKIIYDVMLGKVRLGSATFEYVARTELDQRPADLFTFSTRAARFTDIERIFSDPETFLPLKVERDINGWAKKEKITETYDQARFALFIEKQAGKKRQTTQLKKQGAIHNAVLLPSVVRRSLQFDPGWTFKANLPTQEFTIAFAGFETIALPAGRFKAGRFTSTPERFEIWISADDLKIPLKIKGASGIGYTLVMRTYIKPPNAP